MLKNKFDCVVMLTWSDWFKEMRSNRYNYAVRFAKELPVYFVQPTLEPQSYLFQKTEVNNLEVLHVYTEYGSKQTEQLSEALARRNVVAPLLWIYNANFKDFFLKAYSPFKVYHATEDYFCDDFNQSRDLRKKIQMILGAVDLTIAVSEGIKENLIFKGKHNGPIQVVTNGCDFDFWSKKSKSRKKASEKIAIYQGGINKKIDFELLLFLSQNLQDWRFWFCGEVDEAPEQWEKLLKEKNVKYFGKLHPAQVRNLCGQATVGLIPFVQNKWITESSFPLKAFEYLATGLPVVSVPINSLEKYGSIFQFAKTPSNFAKKMRECAETDNLESINIRLETAAKQNYDNKFEFIRQTLISSTGNKENKPCLEKFNILVLYDNNSIHVNTITDHLTAFGSYSKHNVFYAPATGGALPYERLKQFHAVVIHYSIRLSLTDHLSPYWAWKLKNFRGLKILFIQDEYDTTEVARKWIENLGIQSVYTCVPCNYIKDVYPHKRFPYIDFIENLTGYVPENLKNMKALKKVGERQILIGYRGRLLPYWYGKLGYEKYIIGKRVRSYCENNKISNIDIEWESNKRIYGPAWWEFLGNCRATLGTESGSNVFDFDGQISKKIKDALTRNPKLTFDEAFHSYVKPYEGKIHMNQISPKIFEAIALRTALVLFEGTYSSVILPDIHFIPLKKDFSNMGEVIQKLKDDSYIESLTGRAYQDIIESGKFDYSVMINNFDNYVEGKLRNSVAERMQDLSEESMTSIKYSHGAIQPSKSLVARYSPEKYEENRKVFEQHLKSQHYIFVKQLYYRYRHFPFPGRKFVKALIGHYFHGRKNVAVKQGQPDCSED